MSSQSQSVSVSNIVSLNDHRAFVNPKKRVDTTAVHTSAEMHFKLIDFLKKLEFEASVEVDDLPWIRSQFSPRVRDQVVSSVKKVLCQEFGKKRVSRRGLLFEIQHRDVEPLIASLLRVQFYANQILLPEYNVLGERVDQNGVSVTWGVGRNTDEARRERVKKRLQRSLRR